MALPFLGFSFAFAQSSTRPAGAPATRPASQPAASQPTSKPSKEVVIETTLGNIVVQLTPERTPITVKNFLGYADEKFYEGTIFHRVMPAFIIQGGGYTRQLRQKETHGQIKNESQGALPNTRGTIAMARLDEPDTATSQFFINLVDNPALNYPSNNGGYCVFGRVIEGMDVVDKIAAVPAVRTPFSAGLPRQPVEILQVRRK